jgi:hypothetical protein
MEGLGQDLESARQMGSRILLSKKLYPAGCWVVEGNVQGVQDRKAAGL